MHITHTDIWKLSIPMHPFRIATGVMTYAQNIFVRIHTNSGLTGVGECSAFPMIVGETQATCFEMSKEFAQLWKGKNASDISSRLDELDDFTAFNSTAKSAFDMALYDLAAKEAGQPLYVFLGGSEKEMETDLTIGIDTPDNMAFKSADYIRQGVRIIKIKLGTNPEEDVERVKRIRETVGPDIRLRADANQGWTYEDALKVLNAISKFEIEFCEQPMRYWDDDKLPLLRKQVAVPIMADESVFDHHDAERMIREEACDFVNIKFSKSGGIREASKINSICESHQIPCMMGGMLESRIALSAFAHFASANNNIRFFDMDTCMLGHKIDPVQGGIRFTGFHVNLPSAAGIGADVKDEFLEGCEHISI